ncbi:hypothetical protein KEM52_002361 [Ascosphaera acerosa]|nr:hypothetical protein KEM52_002361 [Ascosphaera acerosa]
MMEQAMLVTHISAAGLKLDDGVEARVPYRASQQYTPSRFFKEAEIEPVAALHAPWADEVHYPFSDDLHTSPTTETSLSSFRSRATSVFDTPLSSQGSSLHGHEDGCSESSDYFGRFQQEQGFCCLPTITIDEAKADAAASRPAHGAVITEADDVSPATPPPNRLVHLEYSFSRASESTFELTAMAAALAPSYVLCKNRHGVVTISKSWSCDRQRSEAAEVFRIASENIQREQWAKYIKITDVVLKGGGAAPSPGAAACKFGSAPGAPGAPVARDRGTTPEPATSITGGSAKRDCFRVVRRKGCRHYDVYHRALTGYLPTGSELAVKCRDLDYSIDVPHVRVSVAPARISVHRALGSEGAAAVGSRQATPYDSEPLLRLNLADGTCKIDSATVLSTFSVHHAVDALVASILVIAVSDPDARCVLHKMPCPEGSLDGHAAVEYLPHVVIPPAAREAPITAMHRALCALQVAPPGRANHDGQAVDAEECSSTVTAGASTADTQQQQPQSADLTAPVFAKTKLADAMVTCMNDGESSQRIVRPASQATAPHPCPCPVGEQQRKWRGRRHGNAMPGACPRYEALDVPAAPARAGNGISRCSLRLRQALKRGLVRLVKHS